MRCLPYLAPIAVLYLSEPLLQRPNLRHAADILRHAADILSQELIEELTATASAPGDRLAESILLPYFAGGTVKNVDALTAQHGAEAVSKAEAALSEAAARGSVEVFPLTRPSESTLPLPSAGKCRDAAVRCIMLLEGRWLSRRRGSQCRGGGGVVSLHSRGQGGEAQRALKRGRAA